MISVVIPTLNAAPTLVKALAPLVSGAAEGLIKQVVVVDGGSVDATRDIADAAGCDVVACAPGRAGQLIAGVGAARGEWLMFMHADTVLGAGWMDGAERFMSRPGATQRAAAFRFAFDDDSAAARRVQFWARLRGAWFKLPYGDQGLLISRAFYDELGGFRPLALMEDVDLVRRIGGKRLTLLAAEAVTCADKYRRDGFQRRAWTNLFLTARYLMGADPDKLARKYA
jgi:rSAM/selenodomain-associated transferase 2